MGPGQALFLLFLVVPIVEIYLLIKVGSMIGALATVGLVVLTAVVGSAMLRQQGLSTLRRAQRNMDQGVLPARELLDGVFLVIGGALLLTPGFVTDAIGFLCLLPATRHWMMAVARRRFRVSGSMTGPRLRPRADSTGTTIEGEWRREDDRKP